MVAITTGKAGGIIVTGARSLANRLGSKDEMLRKRGADKRDPETKAKK